MVFKVCCAPETDQQNTTLAATLPPSGTSGGSAGHHNNNNQLQTNKNQHGYNGGSRGVSINTNNDGQSGQGGRAPPMLINTGNNVTSNVIQSTISWPSWGGNDDGNYLHSTPLTSTISVQQYYPHYTSPRPNINSAINNNNYNSNNNRSNYAPSHKPTKKTSKYNSFFFCSCIRILI